MVAAGGANLEVVRELLKSGADVNKKDNKGGTAFNWAYLIFKEPEQQTEIFKELLKAGASVDKTYVEYRNY